MILNAQHGITASIGESSVVPGDDELFGGPGNDHLYGNGGQDFAKYVYAMAPVTASLAAGKASADGYGGTDLYFSIENLEGSDLNDHLTGDDNANVLKGNFGSDQLFGGDGDDVLYGGEQNIEWIYGNGQDNDYLNGGPGNDLLHGGPQNDIFVFANGDGSDIIDDYSAGEIIDLQPFGFTAGTTEEIVNGSKIITVENDVVIKLLNYTGAVTYKRKLLSTE